MHPDSDYAKDHITLEEPEVCAALALEKINSMVETPLVVGELYTINHMQHLFLAKFCPNLECSLASHEFDFVDMQGGEVLVFVGLGYHLPSENENYFTWEAIFLYENQYWFVAWNGLSLRRNKTDKTSEASVISVTMMKSMIDKYNISSAPGGQFRTQLPVQKFS
jgi:hypothetical protein